MKEIVTIGIGIATYARLWEQTNRAYLSVILGIMAGVLTLKLFEMLKRKEERK